MTAYLQYSTHPGPDGCRKRSLQLAWNHSTCCTHTQIPSKRR
jgi:hypothetical protein